MSEDTTLQLSQLPAEIVGKIIFLLPLVDRRTALSVSRQFHAFAVALVFSTIHLDFGHWSTLAYNRISEANEVDFKVENRLSERSWDILEYILDTPEFGRLVKKIVVHAFGKDDLRFQSGALTRAFRSVPNLTSFHWTGVYPHIPVKVVTGLANFCPKLEELRVPGVPGFDTPDVSRLVNLQSFQFSPEWNVWVLIGSAMDGLHFLPYPDKMPESLTSVINASGDTLQKISMFGPYSSILSPQILDHLSELCLWKIDDPSNIGPVLHKAGQLRSLTLDAQEESNIGILFEDKTLVFPDLAAFRLIVESGGDDDVYSGLAGFIQRHPSLQKLALDVTLCLDSFFSCLSAFSVINRLETLSLTLPVDWSEEFVRTTFSLILNRVHALCFDMQRADFTLQQSDEFARKLTALPSLLFIHILTSGYDDLWSPDDPHSNYMALAHDSSQLRFLGVDRTMARLTRDSSNPADVQISRWPDGLMSTSAEDFDGLEEAEWLMELKDLGSWTAVM